MSRRLDHHAGRCVLLAAALTAVMFGSVAPWAQAQRRVELIGFTNTLWRYEASGADQGVAWRSRTFDDASWPSGLGLLGFENIPSAYPYPFNTTFIPFDPNIITYYFRAHFDMAASDLLFPLTLICSNLVDDGCVVYLNSNEVHRIRVPNGQSFLTPASGSPAIEGVFETPVNIASNSLRLGDNVIAVEVHQISVGSGDMVHGLSLTAIIPTAVSITSQPQSQTTVPLGTSVVLNVGTTGGPAFYQWRRDNGSGAFTNVPGAIGSSYTNTPTLPGTATYQVVVSNGVNSVTSSPAVVTAIADTFGPVMLSAIVLESNSTNRILVAWNERLNTTTICPGCVTNFTVVMVASNVTVAVSNVLYNPTGGPGGTTVTSLIMSTSNWFVGSNYYVSVKRVRDVAGNVVAPDSRVTVSWPRHTELIQADQVWSFHSAAVFEPDIFDQPWYATNYVEGPWWGKSSGPFCGGPVLSTCFGPLLTEIGYQPEPSLFRTTFVVPTNSGLGTQLSIADFVDDAVIYYLNGKEVYRNNLATSPTPPTSLTRAIASTVTLCRSNIVISGTNLLVGTNWLAAAVCQYGVSTDADSAFGLRLRFTEYIQGSLPDVPRPQLNIAAEGMNRFRLWWDGPGYTLESTTNLVFTATGATGAWLEVTNMSNPFFDVLTGERRYFRLRK